MEIKLVFVAFAVLSNVIYTSSGTKSVKKCSESISSLPLECALCIQSGYRRRSSEICENEVEETRDWLSELVKLDAAANEVAWHYDAASRIDIIARNNSKVTLFSWKKSSRTYTTIPSACGIPLANQKVQLPHFSEKTHIFMSISVDDCHLLLHQQKIGVLNPSRSKSKEPIVWCSNLTHAQGSSQKQNESLAKNCFLVDRETGRISSYDPRIDATGAEEIVDERPFCLFRLQQGWNGEQAREKTNEPSTSTLYSDLQLFEINVVMQHRNINNIIGYDDSITCQPTHFKDLLSELNSNEDGHTCFTVASRQISDTKRSMSAHCRWPHASYSRTLESRRLEKTQTVASWKIIVAACVAGFAFLALVAVLSYILRQKTKSFKTSMDRIPPSLVYTMSTEKRQELAAWKKSDEEKVDPLTQEDRNLFMKDEAEATNNHVDLVARNYKGRYLRIDLPDNVHVIQSFDGYQTKPGSFEESIDEGCGSYIGRRQSYDSDEQSISSKTLSDGAFYAESATCYYSPIVPSSNAYKNDDHQDLVLPCNSAELHRDDVYSESNDSAIHSWNSPTSESSHYKLSSEGYVAEFPNEINDSAIHSWNSPTGESSHYKLSSEGYVAEFPNEINDGNLTNFQSFFANVAGHVQMCNFSSKNSFFPKGKQVMVNEKA